MTVEDILSQNVYFPYFPSAYAVGDFLDLVEAYNRSIMRVADEASVPIADLAGAFRRVPDVSGHFTDTVHLSYSGHELIAATFEATLARHGLDGPVATGGLRAGPGLEVAPRVRR
jgi:hypothetical protein